MTTTKPATRRTEPDAASNHPAVTGIDGSAQYAADTSTDGGTTWTADTRWGNNGIVGGGHVRIDTVSTLRSGGQAHADEAIVTIQEPDGGLTRWTPTGKR